ncbi:MAG: alkaline phosphatase family protein [Candidatus Auribacterota bacterium]|nr:alkaline phosphatase family protein [Candidatus Auribacterota bacterium]
MKDQPKLVIIGLDGAPYRLIKDFTENDIMPEIGKIIKKGTFLPLESTIPEISSLAWSSIITGKNPGGHGIFGFTDIPIGTYRLTFPNFNNLKALPFWQKDTGRKSIIVNVPSTFPVKPLNGIHISGFVSLDLERSVYPQSLIPELEALNYRIDVDAAKAHQSTDLFLKDLDETLDARIRASRYLWKNQDWDTFMLVFTGTDRLSHFLWDAYEDRDHPYHSTFLNHFRKIDRAIGEIARSLTEDDLIVLLSDHGFELSERDVNINYLLQESGYLKLDPQSRRGLAGMDEKTRAFALDPARIYLNVKDKYPRGGVTANDFEMIIEDLISLFTGLQYKGRKVIDKIYRKDEIYSGPYTDQAPDLVLISNHGFNLRSGIRSASLYEKSIFTGKHSQPDAFLLLGHPVEPDQLPERPSVSDVLNIISKLAPAALTLKNKNVKNKKTLKIVEDR